MTSTTTGGGGGGGGRSSKSRSPVGNMADLALAETPDHFIHRKSEHDLLDDMRGLFRRIRQVRRGAGIVPKSMVDSV